MQHVVGFCSCFPHFEKEFYTNSLLLYRLHTKCAKMTTRSITKPFIKTTVQSTWNKMACVTNGQVTRSLKRHLTWPMHCWFIEKFQELFEHTVCVCVCVCVCVNI
jgi:hypothetical protein